MDTQPTNTVETHIDTQTRTMIAFYATRIERILALYEVDPKCALGVERCTTKIRELLNGKQLENLTEPDEETEVTP